MIYLDTSALVKLVVREAESAALVQWLAQAADRDYATSALGRVELMRTVLRSGEPATIANARRILDEDLDTIHVTGDVIALAETIGPESLRSLDTIHLASAAQLGAALSSIVVYDHRLIEGCRSLGLPIASPGATQPD